MNRGQKWCLVAGVAATALVLSYLVLSGEIRIQYFLYQLKSGSSEYLGELMGRPEGTAERRAVTRFVVTAPGKQRLLSLAVGELDASLNQRRGRRGGSPPPTFKDLDYAFCGMRFRTSKSAWVLWADMRWPGAAHRGTVAMLAPAAASGDAFADVLEAVCRETDPREELILPEYPELRFSIDSFEKGLARYEAMLGAQGKSIERTAYWYETLEDWRDMLRSRTLLPWVILSRRVGR